MSHAKQYQIMYKTPNTCIASGCERLNETQSHTPRGKLPTEQLLGDQLLFPY